MGIVLWDNIDYKGKKPLDSRMLFDTIAEMKNFNENYLPDITLAFNKADSKMYVFNRTNDVDVTTGKWREFEGGATPEVIPEVSTVAELTTYLESLTDTDYHKVNLTAEISFPATSLTIRLGSSVYAVQRMNNNNIYAFKNEKIYKFNKANNARTVSEVTAEYMKSDVYELEMDTAYTVADFFDEVSISVRNHSDVIYVDQYGTGTLTTTDGTEIAGEFHMILDAGNDNGIRGGKIYQFNEDGEYVEQYNVMVDVAEGTINVIKNWTLVDLKDTNITTPITGQSLVFDGTTQKWINGKASNVLTFKWSVADYASLPSSGQEVGDVWNCLDNNKNYVWTGTAWDEFSSSYTFSNVDVKNSWVKILYALESGSKDNFIVGDVNGGTTMKVKRGVGECVADFMTINLTGVGRGKYVTIKVKNNNVDYVTDVMNYMEFWGCGNTNYDWSWFWWSLGSFDTIKREAVFVIDTDKEFQPQNEGTKVWANIIQFNTRRFYQAAQKKLQALSADFELSVYIQTKETKASNIIVADTADSAKDAGHAELAHMVGVKPLTGVYIESWFGANKWPNTPSNIFSTTLIGGSKIRMNIASFTKNESTTQYYYVYSRPVKKYLNKWYKFFVRVNQTSPAVAGSSVAINEFHFSTRRDMWGAAVAMNHTITPSLATVKGMTSYVAEITPNQYTWSASEVYLLVSAFTTNAWTYSANTCDIEVFVTEPGYFLPYNTYSMVSKSEMDAAISAAADSHQNCITFWWDSLTAWGGWTTRLASLAGMTERNGGTWGENARTIVARQGADVMMINNKTIPASGAVTLYTRSGDVGIPTQEWYKVTPLLQGGAHVNPVKIGDITGTLAWTGSSYSDQNGTWTFTRSTAGSEVTIDRPTAMTTNFDRTYNNPHLMVIFIGQNGWYSDLDDLVRQHRLMIDHAKAKHYIVLWLSSGSAEQRADYETRMKKEFGRYFISLREYLSTPIYENGNIVSCYGMADQNVAVDPEFTYDGKTTLQEIAAGICPHQILADSVHYTAWTKTVIGDYLYKKCKELWIF